MYKEIWATFCQIPTDNSSEPALIWREKKTRKIKQYLPPARAQRTSRAAQLIVYSYYWQEARKKKKKRSFWSRVCRPTLHWIHLVICDPLDMKRKKIVFLYICKTSKIKYYVSSTSNQVNIQIYLVNLLEAELRTFDMHYHLADIKTPQRPSPSSPWPVKRPIMKSPPTITHHYTI